MEFGDYHFDHFLQGHKMQLEAAGIPPDLWGSLYSKLMQQTFDAGNYFRILCEQTDDGPKWCVFATKDLDPLDEYNIFLVDHAWTFQPQHARAQLEEFPQLVERLKSLFNIEADEDCHESGDENEVTSDEQEKIKVEQQLKASYNDSTSLPRQESVDARLCYVVNEHKSVIDKILQKMWSHIQTYSIRYKQELDEESMPLWYVMDELGARISHSDTPNVKVVPLYFIPHKIAYSVIFLIKGVADGEVICRDFTDHSISREHPEWRRFLMLPYLDDDFLSMDRFQREPPGEQFFLVRFYSIGFMEVIDLNIEMKIVLKKILGFDLYVVSKPSENMMSSGRTLDEIPSDYAQGLAADVIQNRDFSGPLRIFADELQLINNLKTVKYVEVCDWRNADVIWLRKHFHDYAQACKENPGVLINQFPYESCLTVKDLLSAIIMNQEDSKNGLSWYQCFLHNVLAVFMINDKKRFVFSGLDNTWIIKPWNLARGMDMHVSNDLRQIVRLMESGPKIACKYIERPVLFRRVDNNCMVKFDIRFIVFVTQVRPLRAFVYNNFWTRFAINEFSLDRLDDVDTHFTVFNYDNNEKILQMNCIDFIDQLEKTYVSIKWATIESKIRKVLQEKEVIPTLLEFNFMPDCERACRCYPDFADTVFQTLFLGEVNVDKVTEI
ncbi:Tubulin-tyrosine ligase family protein [Dictyocaulus viviparus]|uniref:Tubulin-tyrosine ligase family protein n=1 Tax=Dictyocaulus viviparus TaxID=29172 RepID=A0A0D8Y2G2_DICVI|nr:Tubulin-tyrosine ligase family protein [Dictyocaulus viviparus]